MRSRHASALALAAPLLLAAASTALADSRDDPSWRGRPLSSWARELAAGELGVTCVGRVAGLPVDVTFVWTHKHETAAWSRSRPALETLTDAWAHRPRSPALLEALVASSDRSLARRVLLDALEDRMLAPTAALNIAEGWKDDAALMARARSVQGLGWPPPGRPDLDPLDARALEAARAVRRSRAASRAIAAMLASSDPAERSAAARACAQYGEAGWRHLDAILALHDDAIESGRVEEAAATLSAILALSPEAELVASRLSQALVSGDTRVGVAALMGMAAWPDLAAGHLPEIAGRLNDGGPEEAFAAGCALATLGSRAEPALPYLLTPRLLAELRAGSRWHALQLAIIAPPARLARWLRGEDPLARAVALETLRLTARSDECFGTNGTCLLATRADLAALVSLLRSPDPDERRVAAEILDNLDGQLDQFAPALLQALRDPDPTTRATARSVILGEDGRATMLGRRLSARCDLVVEGLRDPAVRDDFIALLAVYPWDCGPPVAAELIAASAGASDSRRLEIARALRSFLSCDFVLAFLVDVVRAGGEDAGAALESLVNGAPPSVEAQRQMNSLLAYLSNVEDARAVRTWLGRASRTRP